MELYFAAESAERCPTHHQVVEFLADFHGLTPEGVFDDLFERTGEDAVRHLFTVAASLDSMVVGEAQILSQVKQAYEQATAGDATGPLTHAAFQAAIRVAKRVAHETAINQKRVSIPSVAVADFAKQFFERFDDKQVLVIGAGEMGEETLRYLIDEGAQHITIVNRNPLRAQELASRLGGTSCRLGGTAPLAGRRRSGRQHHRRDGADRPPGRVPPHRRRTRSAAAVRSRPGRSPRLRPGDRQICSACTCTPIDDLQKACEANRQAREREWPKAERIIEEETARFMAELNHRSTGPTIRRLRERAEEMKEDELRRLFNKLGCPRRTNRGRKSRTRSTDW